LLLGKTASQSSVYHWENLNLTADLAITGGPTHDFNSASCSTTLTDPKQYVAAVLMDLSKAFDCLPHDILLDKLSAYGMSTDSVSLLESYLSNRKQQIKINGILSSWSAHK
jgi:hypothetical protein